MALVDVNGRYLEVNTTHARMLGVDDPRDMIGLSFEEFVHPDDVADTYAGIKRLHETGTDRGERRYIRRDGATVYALFGSPAVRRGRATSVLFTQVEEITDRKLAEAEAFRLNAELERRVLQRTAELRAANQELEGFAYSLAHDLRAPIRAINGFGAALSENHGDELGGRGPGDARSDSPGERQDGRADRRDAAALAEPTRRELNITSVDLSADAREISEELRALDPARSVEFVIADGLDTVGDQRLVQVLMRNLLENAWKYTSLREHARIEVMRAGAGVFAVTDNGVGFNMAFADMLFKPFARLHREDEFPGIGVGLTTVERIVSRHGGAVWGEGRLGEGATFYFKLEPSTETGS